MVCPSEILFPWPSITWTWGWVVCSFVPRSCLFEFSWDDGSVIFLWLYWSRIFPWRLLCGFRGICTRGSHLWCIFVTLLWFWNSVYLCRICSDVFSILIFDCYVRWLLVMAVISIFGSVGKECIHWKRTGEVPQVLYLKLLFHVSSLRGV